MKITIPNYAQLIEYTFKALKELGGSGNNTEIKSYRRRHVFENVKFGGSFTGSVQSQWFPLLYGIKVDNSNELNCALELASLSSFKYLSLNFIMKNR